MEHKGEQAGQAGTPQLQNRYPSARADMVDAGLFLGPNLSLVSPQINSSSDTLDLHASSFTLLHTAEKLNP